MENKNKKGLDFMNIDSGVFSICEVETIFFMKRWTIKKVDFPGVGGDGYETPGEARESLKRVFL